MLNCMVHADCGSVLCLWMVEASLWIALGSVEWGLPGAVVTRVRVQMIGMWSLAPFVHGVGLGVHDAIFKSVCCSALMHVNQHSLMLMSKMTKMLTSKCHVVTVFACAGAAILSSANHPHLHARGSNAQTDPVCDQGFAIWISHQSCMFEHSACCIP